ncbi:hypothetical protein PNI0010_01061 [Streptococcus pneumoniae PNI0010]|nr:hypothetical protein PNI0006_01604 [Streptococcus pneumoniae PNI0006]ELU76988.1 hypothetical protein PNI0010_01061 [Streptococcus pneumoniae PNI0010]ELU87373.1 hypothetical protein PNI0360_01539 [Streptococcus pneumoniae PNI0360]
MLQCNPLNSSFSFFQSFLLSIIAYFLRKKKGKVNFNNYLTF